MRKKFLLSMFFLMSVSGFAILGHLQAMEIEKYDTLVTIYEDMSVVVQESIVVNYPKKSIGFFRDIPIRYRWEGHSFSYDPEVQGVTDETGVDRPYKIELQKDDLIIWLGDPKFPVQGMQTYKITYRIPKGAVVASSAKNIFYWHPIGNGWEFPVRSARYEVTLPENVSDLQASYQSYRGKRGKKQKAEQIPLVGHKPTLESSQPFLSDEAWITTISWQQGSSKS